MEGKMIFIYKLFNLADFMNLHSFSLRVHLLVLPHPHQASSKVCVCQWPALSGKD